jgi:hypothetical protein
MKKMLGWPKTKIDITDFGPRAAQLSDLLNSSEAIASLSEAAVLLEAELPCPVLTGQQDCHWSKPSVDHAQTTPFGPLAACAPWPNGQILCLVVTVEPISATPLMMK